jgi:hypothetical protein
MGRSLLARGFDTFFTTLNAYTDLLLKLYQAREVVLPPAQAREIVKTILPDEKRHVHEAFVLKIYASWEVLVENIFVECLRRDPSTYAERKGLALPRILSRDVSRGMLSGLGYFDFRDTGDLKGKARVYLATQYNPFEHIPRTAAGRIDEFCIIRNYLAHCSDSARHSLARMYKKRYQLPFRQPGDFFFEWDRQGRQVRFASYTNAFIQAANAMAQFLNIEP